MSPWWFSLRGEDSARKRFVRPERRGGGAKRPAGTPRIAQRQCSANTSRGGFARPETQRRLLPAAPSRDPQVAQCGCVTRNRPAYIGKRPRRPEDDQRTALPQVRATRGTAPKGERTRRSLSYSGLATLLVALIMIVGSVAAAFWQWSAITEFYVFLSHTGWRPQGQASHKTPPAQPKLSGRVVWLRMKSFPGRQVASLLA